ncbi:MAG: hypothetical protein CMB82_11300, partial [Flammeovirgaceae bacterium]|nr:hypothetical protein [Flammeovirgaceae bacterium]
KYINYIVIAVLLLQCLPGLAIFFSEEIGQQLINQSFGNGNQITNEDALRISKTFMSVFPFIGLGIAFIILGLNNVKNQALARKLCVYVAAFMGFFALPDVINTFTDLLAQPAPVIVINFLVMGLLLYGSKNGTI